MTRSISLVVTIFCKMIFGFASQCPKNRSGKNCSSAMYGAFSDGVERTMIMTF